MSGEAGVSAILSDGGESGGDIQDGLDEVGDDGESDVCESGTVDW